MSILDGLRRRRWPALNPSDDEARLMQLAHNQALNDVREALTSEATVKAAAEVLCNTVCTCGKAGDDALGFLCCECDARAVLAFLAGGDQ